jgi:hypothetical protein
MQTLPKMQDVYLPIADALARPLRHVKRSGVVVVLLYQLWRADFAALGRLSLTCREASMAVRRLLWASTPLGQRELSRRAQVQRARAFMRQPTMASLLVSRSWTREHLHPKHYVHVRSRTAVAFNGRVCVRESRFYGRSLRQPSPTSIRVGLTLTAAVRQRGGGRILLWNCGGAVPFHTGAFTEYDGALGVLRYITFIGRERWDEHPALRGRFRGYHAHSLGPNLNFEAIVPTDPW